jgi:YVTN family beta-propeller protein
MFALALLACLPLCGQSGGIPTGGFPNFDDWQNAAEAALADGARQSHSAPGTQATTSLTVCIDGELAQVNFVVTVFEGGGASAFTIGGPTPAGEDCKPSNNLENGELGNPKVLKSVENQVANLLNGKDRESPQTPWAVGAASTNFAVFPSFQDVPFIPLFPLNSTLGIPCNPANGANILEVNHGGGTVTLYSGCTRQVIQSIPVVSAPLQVDVTPDASTAIVTSFNNAVNFIDLATNTVSGTLETPYNIFPSGIAISSDGSTAYVTSFSGLSFGTPALLTIDIATRSIVNQMSVVDFPQSVFLTPDDELAFVMHPLNNQVTVVNTLTNTVHRAFTLTAPFAVAFNSTATRAYITSGGNPGSVVVFDTATFATVATIPVGNTPVDIVMSPENGVLFVNNFMDQTLTLIDPVSYAVIGTYPWPGQPRGLAMIQ